MLGIVGLEVLTNSPQSLGKSLDFQRSLSEFKAMGASLPAPDLF